MGIPKNLVSIKGYTLCAIMLTKGGMDMQAP